MKAHWFTDYYVWLFAPLALIFCPVPLIVFPAIGTVTPAVLLYLLVMVLMRGFGGNWQAFGIFAAQVGIWLNVAIVLPMGLRYLALHRINEQWRSVFLAAPLVALAAFTFIPVMKYQTWKHSTGTYTFWEAARLWIQQEPAKGMDWHRPQDW